MEETLYGIHSKMMILDDELSLLRCEGSVYLPATVLHLSHPSF